MNMIYLDNSATTELCATAKERMLEAMESYGNPSSKHKEGIQAKKLVDRARESVKKYTGSIVGEEWFTLIEESDIYD